MLFIGIEIEHTQKKLCGMTAEEIAIQTEDELELAFKNFEAFYDGLADYLANTDIIGTA